MYCTDLRVNTTHVSLKKVHSWFSILPYRHMLQEGTYSVFNTTAVSGTACSKTVQTWFYVAITIVAMRDKLKIPETGVLTLYRSTVLYV